MRTDLNAIMTTAMEKGQGKPVMIAALYHWVVDTWVLLGEYDVIEGVFARTRLDFFVQENLLVTGLIESVSVSDYAIEIEKGVYVGDVKYSIAGNLYYVSNATYSDHWGNTHIVADLLPTTALVAIDGNQTASAVISAAFAQFDNLSTITLDATRDIWFNWKFFEIDKDLNLIDGRQLEYVIQQKYFAYMFPRHFHLIYFYGVASNSTNNEDGTYTPFAHARTTYFLYPDKPINLTWDSETGYNEYVDLVSNTVTSLGYIDDANNPAAVAAFQEWTRIFNGVAYQYIQRPDLRLEQGDLLKVSTDGFTKTRCFELIEVYKSTNAMVQNEGGASWYQVVRQLPYHPQYNIPTVVIDEPHISTPAPAPAPSYTAPAPAPSVVSNPVIQPPHLNPYKYPTPSPNLAWIMSASFSGILSQNESNVQEAFEVLDKHNHDAAYAAIADGVTNGDSHDHAGGDGAQIAYSGLSGLPSLPSTDGWTNPNQTWTYASATSMTVPSGAASIYSVGDKWKVTANGVVLQGYVVAVTDTLLTTVGDALTNHTFTNNYYSKALNPIGFKHWFPYTPTGISATNVTLTGRFCVIGRMCFVDFLCVFSGGITFTTYPTLPITASASIIGTIADFIVSGDASYMDSGTAFILNNLYPSVIASGTTFKLLSGTGNAFGATVPITWANQDMIHAHVNYEI